MPVPMTPMRSLRVPMSVQDVQRLFDPVTGATSLRREKMKRSEQGLDRLPALDTLRSAAIGGVVIAHLLPENLPPMPKALSNLAEFGQTGVDLFFVLSGFLIGRILIRDLRDHGDVDLRRFWWRRWMRTFPAYFATL